MTRVRLACLLAPVALLAILSGCATATGAAASVSGHDVTRSDLDRDLNAIIANKALRSDPSIQVVSTPKGTLNSAISASWLSVLVRQVVVDREFARRHLQITAADLATARTNLEQQQFGPAVFNGFPASFRNRVTDHEARIEAVLRSFTGGAQTQAAINAAGQQFTQLIDTSLRRGHLRVDPRYGTVQFGSQGFQIVPPAAPNVREKPGTTTTTAPGLTPGG